MSISYGPITTWPGRRTPHGERKPTPFSAAFADTITLLERELHHLRATEATVELAIPDGMWRLDGRPRAGAQADHPGVVVRAQTKHGERAYSTDRFGHWHANLRAVAIALEDLRRAERYGVADDGQAHAGFAQLPAPGPSAARGRDLIRKHGGVREALHATHPDHGGDMGDLLDVQAAREGGAL